MISIKKKDLLVIILICVLCILFAALFITFVILIGKANRNPSSGERTVETVERKEINVTVVKNEYKYWYASGAHFTADIEVKDPESDTHESFSLWGSDAVKYKDVQEGDTIPATLYTRKVNDQIASQWIRLN